MKLDLEAIKRRLARVPPEPRYATIGACVQSKDTAEFLVHAPGDITALAAEVERLRDCLLWIYENGADEGYDLDGKKVAQRIRKALGLPNFKR